MTVTAGNANGRGWFSIDFTGVAATTGGAIASVLNPEGQSLLIVQAILYVSVNSTGAANLTAGFGTSPTTDYNDAVTALAMAAAAGKFYTASARSASTSTEITAPGVWLATEYCNITGSASTVGLVGTLYLQYLRTS